MAVERIARTEASTTREASATPDASSPPGKLRVAVASSDGRMVDEHFGAALQFIILDLDGEEAHYVETRQNTPSCGSGHGSQTADASAALIGDCQALLTVRAGPPMIARLNARGIRVVLASGSIQESLRRLLAGEHDGG